jgi:hypothetical protein
MLCCISAAGEKIPVFFVLPSGKSSKKKDAYPVLGPRGHLDDSNDEYTTNGAMTEEMFCYNIENFVPHARKNLPEDKWNAVCLDNCKCHVGLKGFQKNSSQVQSGIRTFQAQLHPCMFSSRCWHLFSS